MSESNKDIKTYKGKFYSGEEFKVQGVADPDASILEIFERAAGNYVIKIDAQDLEDFLKGRLPFGNINSLELDQKKRECFYTRIKSSLEYFIGESGYRDISELVYLKQFELDNTRKKGYFRWDDMYFTSVYATDKKGHVRLISYYVPEDYWLGEIPENLLYLEHLEILDLPYNCIEKIPDDFEKLKNLRYLSLYGNEIPEENSDWYGTLHNLSLLEYLDLNSMKIRTLPVDFGNLRNLKYVDLSENNLDTLPDSIGKLRNLEYLNLRNNTIGNLPESIGNLTNLKHLDLRDNNIKTLPDSIGYLTNLKYLNCSFNKIDTEKIPDSIRNLKNFKKVFSDNFFILKRKL